MAINGVRVENLEGSNGPVKNQFKIYTDSGVYFQSYDSVIAYRPYSGKIILDAHYWDYSKTTGKYRNIFLREGIANTRQKIKDGTYLLDDLNK